MVIVSWEVLKFCLCCGTGGSRWEGFQSILIKRHIGELQVGIPFSEALSPLVTFLFPVERWLPGSGQISSFV